MEKELYPRDQLTPELINMFLAFTNPQSGCVTGEFAVQR